MRADGDALIGRALAHYRITAAIGSGGGAWRLPGMAMVHHSQGRRAESDRALSEFIEKYQTGGAHNVAQVYAFRGEADEALQWLERAYAQHDGGMFLVKVDPLLKNLRTDGRFKALLRKMRISAD